MIFLHCFSIYKGLGQNFYFIDFVFGGNLIYRLCLHTHTVLKNGRHWSVTLFTLSVSFSSMLLFFYSIIQTHNQGEKDAYKNTKLNRTKSVTKQVCLLVSVWIGGDVVRRVTWPWFKDISQLILTVSLWHSAGGCKVYLPYRVARWLLTAH